MLPRRSKHLVKFKTRNEGEEENELKESVKKGNLELR